MSILTHSTKGEKMNFVPSPMSKQIKGVLLITIGTILLLHKLGILRQGIDFYIVIVIALYLITTGFLKLDGSKKIHQYFKKEE